ncbi:MAG: hypothetical protein ACRC7N_07470 [Clostridium sp.]
MRKKFFACIIIIALALVGCNYTNGVKVDYKEESRAGHMSATFKYFKGESYSYISKDKGEVLAIDCTIEKEAGEITVALLDGDGKEIWKTDKTETKEIKLDRDDKYKIIINANEAKGSYKVTWEDK